ncbi:hypothetical protein GCM10027429_02860 [Marivirga atlantica]
MYIVCYSRFEYALKMSGFRKKGNYKIAMADIDGFFHSLQSIDLDGEEIKKSVKYILENPPMELQIIRGELEFRPITLYPDNPLESIKDSMRTIRNNFFHGNKQIAGNSFKRNAELITHSLKILDRFVEENSSVRQHY